MSDFARKLFPTTNAFRYRCLNADVASRFPQTIRFASSLNLLHTDSRPVRGQSPTYLWINKISGFQCLAALSSEPSCSEDRLRLPPNRRSSKPRIVKFSTSAKISCGRRWTTQQFVAFGPAQLVVSRRVSMIQAQPRIEPPEPLADQLRVEESRTSDSDQSG